MKPLPIGAAAKKLGVSIATLRRWEQQGKITSLRTARGHRRYHLPELTNLRLSPRFVRPSPPPATDPTPPYSPDFINPLSVPQFLISNSQKQVLSAILAALLTTGGVVAGKSLLSGSHSLISSIQSPPSGQVLASQSGSDLVFNVNIPAKFKDTVEFANGLVTTGDLVTNGNLQAANILYSIAAGDGITIGGTDAQRPTLTNSASVFKTVKVGSDTFSAASLTDTLTLAAGSDISLSLSSSDKKVTIANTYSAPNPGITDGGTVVYLTTATDTFGIGTATSSAKLGIESTLPDLLTASSSGSLKFKITSSGNLTAAGSLNAGGITNAAYHALALSSDSPEESGISALNDLYIGGDLEIDGTIYGQLSGGVTTSLTAGGVVFVGSGGTLTADSTNFSFADSTDKLTVANLSVGTYVYSGLTPDTGSSYDLGTSARRWRNVYGDDANFTNFSSSTTTISGTTGQDFLINTDNATADTEDSTLTFERGTPGTNSQFKWNSASTAKYISANTPLAILPDTGITSGGTAALIVNQPFSQDIFTASASGTARLVLTLAGNLGIGTTTPISKLHVEGACVTADTLIRRRRKKKKKDGKDEWEDVPVTDIEPGDEVMTLNEKTGEFVTSPVRQLMNMGVQKTYLLVTESGKQIRTTAKHPYLVRPAKPEGLTIGGTYQIDQSPRLETLTQDSYIALANKHVQFTAKISKRDKLQLKKLYNKLNQSRYYGIDTFAKSIALLLEAAGIRDAKIQIDRDYSGYENRINEIIKREAKNTQIEYVGIGHNKNSYAHHASYGAFIGKREADMTIKIDRGTLKGVGLSIVTHKDKSSATGNARGRLNGVYLPSLEMSSDARWKKIHELRTGMRIATLDGWETVIAIKKRAHEQVYDLEIENTHNFVANEIVAHNTTGKALGIFNETGDQNILAASASGVTQFTLSRTGDIALTGDAAVNGGDITTTATTFNLLNATATTLNIGGAATTLNFGATTGTTTIANDLTIGNAITDNITFTGRVAADADLIPIGTTGTNDLGASALPWDNLYVDNVITTATSGTQGWWQRNAGVLAPTNITDDLTISGIATSSAKFQIFSATGNATSAGNLTFSSAATIASTAMQTLNLGGTTTGNIQLAAGSATPSFVVTSAGQVGIGTTSPGQKLEVNGLIKLGSPDSFPTRPYITLGKLSDRTSINFYNQPDDSLIGQWFTGTGTMVFDAINRDLGFQVGSTYRLYVSNSTNDVGIGGTAAESSPLVMIKSTGNVGIGTTGPGAKLDVAGNVLLSGGTQPYLFTTRDVNLAIQSQTSGQYSQVELYTKDGDGTDGLAWNIFGKGTPSSVTNRERLIVLWDLTSYGLYTEKGGTGTQRPLFLEADGSGTYDQLYLATTGNVGIGTTAPGSSLDINSAAVVGSENILNLRVSDNSTNYFRLTNSSGTNGVFIPQWTAHSESSSTYTATAYTSEILAASDTGTVPVTRFISQRTNGALTTRPMVGFADYNGNDLVVIGATGNVGIGTTGPTNLLTVSGVTGASNLVRIHSTAAAGSNNAYLKFTNSDTGTGEFTDGILMGLDTDESAVFWNYENQPFRIGTNNAERFRISATGGLALGSTYYSTDPGSGNAIIQGNVGIGTTGPGAKLDILQAWSTTSTIRLGDVTTDATQKLGRLSLRHYTNAEEDITMFMADSDGTNNLVKFGGGTAFGNTATELQFFTAANTTTLTGTQRMTINSTGNVGIGTTAPESKLDIANTVADGTDAVLNLRNSSANASGPIFYGYKSRGTQASKTIILDGDETFSLAGRGYDGSSFTTNAAIAMAVDGTPGASSDMPGRITFKTRPDGTGQSLTEWMRITSTGNVGIGTTSPLSLLHVSNGTIGMRWNPINSNELFAIGMDTADGSDTKGFILQGGGIVESGVSTRGGYINVRGNENGQPGTIQLYPGNVTGSRIELGKSDGNEAMRIQGSTGNVGIGTTGPGALLDVYKDVGGGANVARIDMLATGAVSHQIVFGANVNRAAIGTFTNSDLGFFTNNSNEGQLYLKNNGNVGIGTTGPGTKLDVIGPSGVTSFTGTTKLGVLIQGPANATDYTGIDFNRTSQTGPVGRIAVLSTDSGSYMSFGTSNSYGLGITNTAMTIDYSGNVGIGTTGPAQALDVTGSIRSSGQFLAAIGSVSAPGVSFTTRTTAGLYVVGGNTTVLVDPDAVRLQSGAGYMAISSGAFSDSGLVSFTTGATSFRVTGAGPHYFSSGNVGIGTTVPLSKLHIEGACVTGDTLLPIRRRRRKNSPDADDTENDWDTLLCPVSDIQPGDEVLSYDEAQDALRYAKINQLMDMGIHEVYEIITKSGKKIRTTDNHPYLTLIENS